MKENVFDVLIYLFENYIEDDANLVSDPDEIRNELAEAGFPQAEISKAFHWLESLAEQQPVQTAAPAACRIYCAEELSRLDVECRGYLLFLEQCGILVPTTREMVIDRLMALDEDDINLEDLKWVVLLVLFSQPDEEAAFARMEDLVYGNIPQRWH